MLDDIDIAYVVMSCGGEKVLINAVVFVTFVSLATPSNILYQRDTKVKKYFQMLEYINEQSEP